MFHDHLLIFSRCSCSLADGNCCAAGQTTLLLWWCLSAQKHSVVTVVAVLQPAVQGQFIFRMALPVMLMQDLDVRECKALQRELHGGGSSLWVNKVVVADCGN